jgi:hypothetical protein
MERGRLDDMRSIGDKDREYLDRFDSRQSGAHTSQMHEAAVRSFEDIEGPYEAAYQESSRSFEPNVRERTRLMHHGRRESPVFVREVRSVEDREARRDFGPIEVMEYTGVHRDGASRMYRSEGREIAAEDFRASPRLYSYPQKMYMAQPTQYKLSSQHYEPSSFEHPDRYGSELRRTHRRSASPINIDRFVVRRSDYDVGSQPSMLIDRYASASSNVGSGSQRPLDSDRYAVRHSGYQNGSTSLVNIENYVHSDFIHPLDSPHTSCMYRPRATNHGDYSSSREHSHPSFGPRDRDSDEVMYQTRANNSHHDQRRLRHRDSRSRSPLRGSHERNDVRLRDKEGVSQLHGRGSRGGRKQGGKVQGKGDEVVSQTDGPSRR